RAQQPMPTPQLIESYVSGCNPFNIGELGNNFEFTLPNAVLSGNCLVLEMTLPNETAVFRVTDNNCNAWPGSPSLTVNGGTGNYNLLVFVLPNANAGVTTITINLSASSAPFAWRCMEWNNIATSSPVNGTAGTANVMGSSLSTGSFTPGNNDANGGNLI